MNMKMSLVIAAAAITLSACDGSPVDKTVDRGVNSHPISELQAGIWVDPNGCDHWIIDDGVEGYLSARLDKYGKPVCSGIAAPGTAVGNYDNGVAAGV